MDAPRKLPDLRHYTTLHGTTRHDTHTHTTHTTHTHTHYTHYTTRHYTPLHDTTRHYTTLERQRQSANAAVESDSVARNLFVRGSSAGRILSQLLLLSVLLWRCRLWWRWQGVLVVAGRFRG